MAVSILAKERTIAGPGFNRWLVPPAALAIHLCIGMAYGFSVFWLPLSRAVGITRPCRAARHRVLRRTVRHRLRLADLHDGVDVHLVLRLPRLSAALWGGWLERAGPRKAGVVSAVCWCGGLVSRPRRVHAPDVADVARLRRHRRHRARPRVHLARLDPDQVVPGPPRHGHRHGDHGLRRRRDDRLAAGGRTDETFSSPTTWAWRQRFARDGARLLRVHDRRAPSATACHPAAGRPKAGRRRRPRRQRR